MKREVERFILKVALIGLLLCGAAEPARAAIAFTIDNTTGEPLGNPPFTLGFHFLTNQAITVTQLGLFDDSLNGLVESHDIGLWDSSGTLLTSGTIGSGVVAPLIDGFRYINIAPVALAAGQQYAVGALYTSGADLLVFPGDAANFATNAAIAFVSATYAVGGTLSNPVNIGSNAPAYFGPNFQFNVTQAAVPEPTTLAAFVLGMGLFGVGGGLRRWRRAA